MKKAPSKYDKLTVSQKRSKLKEIRAQVRTAKRQHAYDEVTRLHKIINQIEGAGPDVMAEHRKLIRVAQTYGKGMTLAEKKAFIAKRRKAETKKKAVEKKVYKKGMAAELKAGMIFKPPKKTTVKKSTKKPAKKSVKKRTPTMTRKEARAFLRKKVSKKRMYIKTPRAIA